MFQLIISVCPFQARPKNEQQNFRKGGQDSASHDESKRRSPTSQTSPKVHFKHLQR